VGFGSKCTAIQNELSAWPGHHTKVLVSTLKADTPFEIYEGSTLLRVSPK